MDPFHERLAHAALTAAGRYGFALAGGYAVQAAGLLQRPSEDVVMRSVKVSGSGVSHHDGRAGDLRLRTRRRGQTCRRHLASASV